MIRLLKDPGYRLWLVIFLFLFGFASAAWFERMNSDAGYYLFHAINKKWFYLEHQRYVLAIAELPALIPVWLGLPLKWVVVAYSLGHVMFFVLASLLAFRISGNKNLMLLIALLGIAGLRESVYTPQFELYYGLVFLLLAFAYYISEKPGYLKYSGLAICLIAALTSHPFAVICALFLFIFHQAYSGKIWIRDTLIFIFLLAIYYFWKKSVASGYESGKIQMFADAFREGRYRDVLQWKNIVSQFVFLIKYYPDVLLFFAAGMVFLMVNKKYVAGFLYFIGILLFLLLVWMLYPAPEALFRYLEQVYFPFVFMALVFVVFVKNTGSKGFRFLVLLCIGFRVYFILEAYPVFRERTKMMDRLISAAEKQGGQRFYVVKDQMGERQYNLADWSYGFETLVRSAITADSAMTITKDEDLYFNHNDSLLERDEYLFRMWEREKTSQLNTRYFKLEDGEYRRLD